MSKTIQDNVKKEIDKCLYGCSEMPYSWEAGNYISYIQAQDDCNKNCYVSNGKEISDYLKQAP